MLHDILIPCRIGDYYLYTKRVLSFEVTPIMVQGILVEYTGRTITIKNKQTVLLKDFSTQAQASALKKIATNIGTYDEIITSMSSSVVVYKELQLPFLERDAMQMVVPYEVESMLPFALEDAVIDFIITQQDLQKKQSTLLVAAVRKEDVLAQKTLFEKAELSLHILTIDMFALYEIYKKALWSAPVGTEQQKTVKVPSFFDTSSFSVITLWHNLHAKFLKKSTKQEAESVVTPLDFMPKRAELLVDIGFDAVRVLYMQDGILCVVRMIPMGILDMAQGIVQQTELSYYDVIQDILMSQATQDFENVLKIELKKIFEEIARTLLFFEKQEGQVYLKPDKLWFSGFATTTSLFYQSADSFFGNIVQIVDSAKVISSLKISMKAEDHSVPLMSIGLGLFTHFEPNVNFLKLVVQKSDQILFNKQIAVTVLMTLLCIGATFWRSFTLLQEKESAYLSSKKQFMQSVQQQMHLDLKNEKNIKLVVEKAEDVLKREKALWFAFSAQQEKSVLEYLQDLSIQIDREAIGLQLRQMHLDFQKVTMTGSVKSFEALDIFEEELLSLQLLQVIDKPRELSFTVELKPKEEHKGKV